ncbi:MAG: hypothetical protein ACJAS9_002729 [Polaribacter sp.]|jgi:hypothetical protein
MGIKRLKHDAQNFGQIFCGWELMFDYKTLADLKVGVLKLNILTQECLHNEQKIEPLNIVKGIHLWMLQDLKYNNIHFSVIEAAEITVKFETTREKGQTEQSSSWSDLTPFFIKCKLSCDSLISTKENNYKSSYIDFKEWPESY